MSIYKRAYHLSFLVVGFIFLYSSQLTAQTADNSFTISGGKFGKGTNFVFPVSKDNSMNQVTYTGSFFKTPGDHSGVVHLMNDIETEGKKINFDIVINFSYGTGPGSYTFSSDKQPLPPIASCTIQREDVGDGQGFSISGEKGNVIVTGYSGKGGYMIGTFSGTFIHMTTPPEGSSESPVIDQRYQVNGHFKAYSSPYEGQ